MLEQKARDSGSFSKRSSLSTRSYSLINSLVFRLLPGVCVLCQLPSARQRDLCLHCENSLLRTTEPCEKCGEPIPFSVQNLSSAFSETDTKLFSGIGFTNSLLLPLTHKVAHCEACQSTTHFSEITKTVAPLSYAGCSRWLVQQQKQRKGSPHGRVLAELLGDAVSVRYDIPQTTSNEALNLPLPDLLLPVPLHWRRHLARGHNQSTLLANNLGRRFALPVACSLIKRTHATKIQRALSAKQRALNLAHAFVATKTATGVIQNLPNRRIAIVDDVVTTGATGTALARVLLACGAQEIHLWSPCRAILRH